MLRNPDDDLCGFLLTALRVWGGPGRSSDHFARSLGFADKTALHSKSHGFIEALDSARGLDFSDLPVAIRLARVAAFDDYYGAGSEWATVTGFSIEEANVMFLALEAMFESTTG